MLKNWVEHNSQGSQQNDKIERQRERERESEGEGGRMKRGGKKGWNIISETNIVIAAEQTLKDIMESGV